jgi:membrane protein DedA with SNARE-associated domain
MEMMIQWIVTHAEHAHWIIFFAILLAGVNIPISADILIVGASFLAATCVPHHTWHLYLAILIGCYFSAWIAYGMGRTLGQRIVASGWGQKFFPAQRIEKILNFYKKHGFLTLLIGRFIPFGIRNCIFMSSGMSRLSFVKFALWDLVASFVWCSVSFYLFFNLGKNLPLLLQHLKIINISLFIAFSVTGITLLWYKRRKKTSMEGFKAHD